MNRTLMVFAAAFIISAALATPGCRGAGDGLSTEQQSKANQLDEVAKRTGGEWDKLNAADRKFLLDLESGNENSARMLLMAKTGHFRGGHSGPPGSAPAPK